MTEESKSLALAFWRRSKEFFEAANLVAEASGDRVSIPAYYLWAHSIELSLKVFLITKGIPLRELKSRKLGHSLMALWQRGVSLGLGEKIHLYPTEIGTILLLSRDYADKKFEYAESKNFDLPFMHLMKRTSDRLLLLLNPERM